MHTWFKRRHVSDLVARAVLASTGALLGVLPAAAQVCNCSCDPDVPQCFDVTAFQLNESGQNTNTFVSAGIGATSVWIQHANKFTQTQTITHVCIALRNPSTGSGGGDVAAVFIAGDAGGLPGANVHVTAFIVNPMGVFPNHQTVALTSPVGVAGTYWVGVSYPTARFNIGHQGVRPRTSGDAAVYIDTLAQPWIRYDNTGSGSYIGQAPVIRPLTLAPTPALVQVTPTSGLVTTEAGGAAQFDVVLAGAPPTSDVFINLLSSDPSEGLPTVNQLVFTVFNWNVPQTVTVVGQDDPVVDGNIPYSIDMTVVSGDPCYNGIPVPQVRLTNTDNDSACGAAWSLLQASGPAGRAFHSMAIEHPTRRPVLFGGFTGAAALGSTHRWDGANWIVPGLFGGPTVRYGHGMALHEGSRQLVLFGGRDTAGTHLGDTHHFSGSAWSLASSTGPSPRAHFAMAYDQARARVVLHGGSAGAPPFLDDTWLWDGVVWTQASPLPAPPDGRAFHSMAYDAARQRVVLFGGESNAIGLANDTWEWDGASWIPLPTSPGAPSPRSGHAMAYDPISARTVLFGGSTAGSTYNSDTYVWDGSVWTPLFVPSPAPRTGHAMTLDSAGGHVLLFGGRTGPSSYAGDTWSWTGPTLPTVTSPQDLTATAGSSVTMAVTAIGSGALQYQWRRNTVPLMNGGPIVGADTDTLTIGPVALSDAGAYDVVVTSACGAITSGTGLLDVFCSADWNHDHQITPADIAAFINTWSASLASGTLDGDFNGDGVVTPADVALFVTAWFAALSGSC